MTDYDKEQYVKGFWKLLPGNLINLEIESSISLTSSLERLEYDLADNSMGYYGLFQFFLKSRISPGFASFLSS